MNPDKAVWRGRKKELETIKLQLELGVEDLVVFANGFPDWMQSKEFVTLLKSGRADKLDEAKHYLDKAMSTCDWKLKSHSREDMLAVFGLTRDQIGDPQDKIKRRDKKKPEAPQDGK